MHLIDDFSILYWQVSAYSTDRLKDHSHVFNIILPLESIQGHLASFLAIQSTTNHVFPFPSMQNFTSALSKVLLAKDAVRDRFSMYSKSLHISLSGMKQLSKKEDEEDLPVSTNQDYAACKRLETDGLGNIVKPDGSKITLKGINVDLAMKLPFTPNMSSHMGCANDPNSIFFEGETVSFVGRPFPLEEAEAHFHRIKSWGYNTIRYLITWEALEHLGPGIYDDAFVDYTVQIMKIAESVGGLYIFIEMHQDVWLRFSGGSGAPMWTLHAAGLDPRNFAATEAAVFRNETRFTDPESPLYEEYPKMFWTTNYKRLASLTMFTMFFAGNTYFPNLKINDENIQNFLQRHYHEAFGYLWRRIATLVPSMLASGQLLGVELMNEPNCGLVGHAHLGQIPEKQQLRVGTTPTVYQTFKLGMGLPVEVDIYRITVTGPQKYGTKVVDPHGVRAWLSAESAAIIDKKHGWKRDPSWTMGECIYARQLKVWRWDDLDFEGLQSLLQVERMAASSRACTLRLPNLFNQNLTKLNLPETVKNVDIDFFVNHFFVEFYLRFKETVRNLTPDVFVLLQPPVLEIPPLLKQDPRHVIDSKTIYCPHYYDGMSLMFKTWNSRYNVDTLGIMRSRYYNPVLGIVFGEKAIRNCLRKQFLEIKRECDTHLGLIPVLMSETGMPFDMDGKKAYSDGKYYSQTQALDALSYALEGANIHHTYWCYASVNSHEHGDCWNNEDFSFWSPDDRNLDFDLAGLLLLLPDLVSAASKTQAQADSVRLWKMPTFESVDAKSGRRGSAWSSIPDDSTDQTDIQSLLSSGLISSTGENLKLKHNRRCYPLPDGVRAVGAIIRPFVVSTTGNIKVAEFDMRLVRFSLCVEVSRKKDIPTVIFLPRWHYPNLSSEDIYLTSGTVKYNEDLEYLEWYHQGGSNSTDTIIIKNRSGSLDEMIAKEHQGLFPCTSDINCPVN